MADEQAFGRALGSREVEVSGVAVNEGEAVQVGDVLCGCVTVSRT
jgi:hypothetical protein